MTAIFDREPESARVCCVCGTAGTLGQYISGDDVIVWAHLSCAQKREFEAVDGVEIKESWSDL